MIEPQGAFHAAIRATEDDIAHLQHCLSKLYGSPNHANYARWDSTFHRGIFEAAHNSLFLMLFDAVNDVRNQGPDLLDPEALPANYQMELIPPA